MSTQLIAVPPTAPMLRLVPTPAWEPPYCEPDAAPALSRCNRAGRGPTQGTLALTFLLPSGLPAVPHAASAAPVDLARPARVPRPDDIFDPQPTARADLPDPQLWAGRLAQAMLEVDAGVRPVAQLRRWTSEEVYASLRHRGRRSRFVQTRAAGSNRVWVRSLRICEPADGVAEVSAVVQDGPRTRALAMRLEGTDGRWRCTVLKRL